MTSIFDATGRNQAVTVIELGPCVVTQVKTTDTDGYEALQLAFGDMREKSASQPLRGHFAAAGTSPKRKVAEFRDFAIDKAIGDTIRVEEVFEEGEKISAVGTSKGKGFQGVVKRHGFGGVGQRTHGQHNRGRAPGSVGASSYPSKVFKGMRMAGQTGNQRVKTGNLRVVRILPEQNVILIKAAVPGHKGSFVILEK